MKSLEEQIKFIDTVLLPLFGITNVVDFTGFIDTSKLNIDLNKLNENLQEFRKVFPVKNFNLHKTNYQIISQDQAFNVLKKCLDITNVQYELNKSGLRLIPVNNILKRYIKNTYKMSSERTKEKTVIEHDEIEESIVGSKFSGIKYQFTNDDLIKNIKKEHTYSFQIQPFYYMDDKAKINYQLLKSKQENYIIDEDTLEDISHFFNKKSLKIDLFSFYLGNKNIKSFKCTFKSKKINGIEPISKQYLDLIFSKTCYGFSVFDNGDKFVNGGELLPPNVILLNSLNRFSNNYLIIYDNPKIALILDFLICDIDIVYVDFYKEFEDNLKNARINQLIEIRNSFNILTTESDKFSLKHYEYLSKKR